MFHSFANIIGPSLITLFTLLIMLLSFMYFTVVLKIQSENVTVWIHCLWSFYLLYCIIFYYISCVITDPNGEYVFLTSENMDENCHFCETEKPERAHHCRVCNSCILRMDHHCVWIHNCVGKHNHRYFWLFILYTWIGCFYYFWMSLPLVKSILFHSPVINVEWPFINARNVFLFTGLLSFVAAYGLLGFLIWHSYLILTGQTTIEYLSNRSMRRSSQSTDTNDTIPFIHVYDLGWRQNVLDFFQEYLLLFLTHFMQNRPLWKLVFPMHIHFIFLSYNKRNRL